MKKYPKFWSLSVCAYLFALGVEPIFAIIYKEIVEELLLKFAKFVSERYIKECVLDNTEFCIPGIFGIVIDIFFVALGIAVVGSLYEKIMNK